MTKQIGHDLLVRGQSAADGPDRSQYLISGGVGGDLILNPVDLGDEALALFGSAATGCSVTISTS